MPELSLRRARADESAPVAAIMLRARRATEIPAGVHSDAAVRAWVAERLLPSCDVWVLAAANTPVAMMALSDGWIEQLYVAPEHQRCGYGTRLLRLAQTEQDVLRLWTFASNRGAQRFYESHGFRRDGPLSTANEEHAAAIRYCWERSD